MKFEIQEMPKALYAKQSSTAFKETLKLKCCSLMYEMADSKTFVVMSSLLGERLINKLFIYFAYMAVPVSANMEVDEYNQSAYKILKDLAENKFENAEPRVVTKDFFFYSRSSRMEHKITERLNDILGDISFASVKSNLTDFEFAQIMATAFIEIPSKIQQSFVNTMYETAEQLAKIHCNQEIQIENQDLLKIITAIISVEQLAIP